MTKPIRSTVDAKSTLGVKSADDRIKYSHFITTGHFLIGFKQLKPGNEDILVETYVNVIKEELHIRSY